MKPNNSNPRNGRPLPTLCGGCGGQLTKDYCVPCSVKFLYEISVKLQRDEDEKWKRIRLSRLRLALHGASRYLMGFDTTAIEQAIKAAAARPGERYFCQQCGDAFEPDPAFEGDLDGHQIWCRKCNDAFLRAALHTAEAN